MRITDALYIEFDNGFVIDIDDQDKYFVITQDGGIRISEDLGDRTQRIFYPWHRINQIVYKDYAPQ